jgi:exopolysaccharide production protein ExoQ
MIETNHNELSSERPQRAIAMAWLVGALLACSLIGLVHDPNYATARGAELVEDGRGVDDKTVMENGLDAANAGRAVGLLLLLATGGVCLLTTPKGTQFRRDGIFVLISLGLIWATASVAWSPEPGVTVRELARLFVYAGVAAAVARRFDPRTLCYVIMIALGGSVLAAVSFEIITGGFRPWTTDYRLTGSMHSNILAVQALVVALMAYAFAVRENGRTKLWWSIFIVTAVVIYLTKARTELVSLIAGVAAVHVIGRPARSWLFPAAAGVSLLAIVLLGAATTGASVGRDAKSITTMGRTDDVSALTGRVPLWNYIWGQLRGHELQGFSWGTFWLVDRTLDAHDELGWYPRHSHDAYIQVVVDLGFVGLAIALAIAIGTTARAARLVKLTGRPEYSAIVAVMAGIFVDGVAESAFVMPRDMGLFSAAIVFSMVVVHHHATTRLASAATPNLPPPTFAPQLSTHPNS